MKAWRWVTCLFLVVASPLAGAADKPLPVFVSIPPQQHFVQQIGGDRVTVQVMVMPGASPATYEPKPRQMADLAAAKLYFAIGVPFEAAWLDKIAAAGPGMRVIHTDRGIRKIPMTEHHHGEQGADRHDAPPGRHGEDKPPGADAEPHGGHDHDRGLPDPHIWLSPPMVKLQATAIRDALRAADPEHAADYARRYRDFLREIEAVDRDLRAVFADKEGLRFMVFHPSWGYFAEAYGLEQVAVEIEGKNPKPAQLQGLIAQARKDGIRVVFVQPQFSTRSAELLAREIGGQVVFADPLASNWSDNLRDVAAKIAAALR